MISKRIYAMLLSCSLLTTQALATEYNYTGYFDIRGKCIQVTDDSETINEPQDAVRKKTVSVEVGDDNKVFTSTDTSPKEEISQNAAWFAKEGNDIYIYTKIPSNHAGKKYMIQQQMGSYTISDEAEIVGNSCRTKYALYSTEATTANFYLLEQTGYDVKYIARLDLTASTEKIEGNLNLTNAQVEEIKMKYGNYSRIAYTVDVGEVPDGTVYEVGATSGWSQIQYAKGGKVNFAWEMVTDTYTIRKWENIIISDDNKTLTIQYIEDEVDEINGLTELPDWYWTFGTLYVKKEKMNVKYQAKIDDQQIDGRDDGTYCRFYLADVLSELPVGTYPITIMMGEETMSLTPKATVEESDEKPMITKVDDMAVQQYSDSEQYVYPVYLQNPNNSEAYNERYIYVCDKYIDAFVDGNQQGVLLVNAYTPLTNVVGKFYKTTQIQDDNYNFTYIRSQMSDEVTLSNEKYLLHKDGRSNSIYFCANVEDGTKLQIGEGEYWAQYQGNIDHSCKDLLPILIDEIEDGSYPIIVGGEETNYHVERKSTTYKPNITKVETSTGEDIWGDSKQYHTVFVPDAKVGDVYCYNSQKNDRSRTVICKEDGKLQMTGELGNWVQFYKILSCTCQNNQVKLVISDVSDKVELG